MTTTINASTSAGLVNTADTSGVLQLQTANTAALTIDASQRIGIGGTPSAWSASPFSPVMQFGSTGNITTVSGANGSVNLFNNCYYNGSNYIYQVTDYATRYATGNNGNHIWYNAPSGTAGNAITFTESMRIDTSGNLLVGRTTKQADIAGQTTNVQSSLGFSCYDGTQSAQISPTRIYFNGANGFYVLNASDTGVRLVNGATSWSAQSDERTKTDLIPIANGLEKVNTLRAVTGRYTKDEEGVSRAFLIAQDVKAVLPEAVDEDTDEEKTLGLRYTDVIPLLVASIKELKSINDTQAETINALTARIVALEGK